MSDYKVELENFYGPFDLLLYLIKEEELNIYDIPIARITGQYLMYIESMKQLNIDLASEFLVVAATLMEIKSKTLLPRSEEEPEESDPRFELVRKLIEYKKYKDLSKSLYSLIEKQALTFKRPVIKEETAFEEKTDVLKKLDAWELVKTSARLNKETVLAVPVSIIYDDVPLEHFIKNVMERLQVRQEMIFSELIPDPKDKLNMLKNFLAILELAKQRQLTVNQESAFGEINLKIRHPETETEEQSAPMPALFQPDSLANHSGGDVNGTGEVIPNPPVLPVAPAEQEGGEINNNKAE